MKFLCCLVFVCLFANKSIFAHVHPPQGNRVAPGVPPQKYQPPEQRNQQYQQQQYQPNTQAQQQQQYVKPQQPIGQGQPAVPVIHGGHAHIRPHGQVFDTSNIEMEREHIQEHMDLPIDTSKMSQDELMFHNFKMWDIDNDNVVDGLDFLKYLMQHSGGDAAPNQYDDEHFAEIVDQILNRMDMNKDGITTFSEYMKTTKGYN